MLQFGKNITQIDDPLQKVTVERIFLGIAEPKESLRKQVERLRMVRAMDGKQYARLKKQLPYFVCGNFHPPYRRKENFAAIECFIVDLDHFEEAGRDRREVAEKLKKDGRLMLQFTSPGGDGLKLLFMLAEKCFDPGLYAYFYKSFLQSLAREYGLEKVIDWRTHDVTRACFLSIDPEAYYNPIPDPVILGNYFDAADPDAQREVAQTQKEMREQAPLTPAPKKEELSDEVLVQIKQKLNPNFRPKKKRDAYVPPELIEVMPKVEKALEEVGIKLVSSESIQYGKKLRVAAGDHWAELNIFFGKKGFSVVKTTKSGSREELADMAHQILYEFLLGGE